MGFFGWQGCGGGGKTIFMSNHVCAFDYFGSLKKFRWNGCGGGEGSFVQTGYKKIKIPFIENAVKVCKDIIRFDSYTIEKLHDIDWIVIFWF